MIISPLPTLVTGDDFSLPVNLTASDAAVVLTGAVITAGIVSADHSTLYLGGIAQPEGNPGSAWATGTAGILFSAAQTGGIVASGPALIEIQVQLGGRKTSWFVPIVIVKGHVA